MLKTYYEYPTQVKFYDSLTEEWLGGIAYQHDIICGCCGGFVDIQGVLNDGAEDGIVVPIVELSWTSISNEIKGE
jgi:hypothetical protein